jgi:hypothetical protein
MKVFTTLAIVLAALAAVGCASTGVGDDVIADRAAFALGVNKGDITVSNRTDDGVTTRFAVRTKSGQDYNCSVGSSFTITGRFVSDALCNKKGEAAKNPLLR